MHTTDPPVPFALYRILCSMCVFKGRACRWRARNEEGMRREGVQSGGTEEAGIDSNHREQDQLTVERMHMHKPLERALPAPGKEGRGKGSLGTEKNGSGTHMPTQTQEDDIQGETTTVMTGRGWRVCASVRVWREGCRAAAGGRRLTHTCPSLEKAQTESQRAVGSERTTSAPHTYRKARAWQNT